LWILVDMTRIMTMDEQLPLAEIKAHLSEIVDRIEDQHERVTLTRYGRPVAVLLSPEDLEALEDTLELLADPNARAQIEQARRDIADGKGIRAEELKARHPSKA
jgi:antitoxin YefM